MELDGILNWLFDTQIADAIRENELLFPFIESVHVLAVTVFFGSILWVDLRILRVFNCERKLSEFIGELLPITWLMFLVALITGFALFTSNAVNYAHNWSFQFKMLCLLLAGLNMLGFHIWHHNRVLADDTNYETSASAQSAPSAPTGRGFMQLCSHLNFWLVGRWSPLLSILIWVAVIALGRWIGFSIQPSFAG